MLRVIVCGTGYDGIRRWIVEEAPGEPATPEEAWREAAGRDFLRALADGEGVTPPGPQPEPSA